MKNSGSDACMKRRMGCAKNFKDVFVAKVARVDSIKNVSMGSYGLG